jgi:hypothetical protein
MEDATVQIEFIGARIKTALSKSIAIYRMQMANEDSREDPFLCRSCVARSRHWK